MNLFSSISKRAVSEKAYCRTNLGVRGWNVSFLDSEAHLAGSSGGHLQHDLADPGPEVYEHILTRDLDLVDHLADQLVRRLPVHLHTMGSDQHHGATVLVFSKQFRNYCLSCMSIG